MKQWPDDLGKLVPLARFTKLVIQVSKYLILSTLMNHVSQCNWPVVIFPSRDSHGAWNEHRIHSLNDGKLIAGQQKVVPRDHEVPAVSLIHLDDNFGCSIYSDGDPDVSRVAPGTNSLAEEKVTNLRVRDDGNLGSLGLAKLYLIRRDFVGHLFHRPEEELQG